MAKAEQKTAKRFLEAVLPYLVVKKLQAELLIELEKGVLERGGQKRLSDEIGRRRQIKDKICALNGPALYSKYRETLNE